MVFSVVVVVLEAQTHTIMDGRIRMTLVVDSFDLFDKY